MQVRDRHWVSLSCVLTMTACGAADAPAPIPVRTPDVASAEEGNPTKLVREELVEIAASVEEIDQKTRQVTLRGAGGETTSFRASDSVRNLAQVKKGDLVTAMYYESVAVRLRKSGELTPGHSVEAGTSRAEVGEQPGAAGVRTLTVVATIRALDPGRHTATLETADGKRQTVAVRDPESFEIAAVGDLVELMYTESVAIAVEKASVQ